MSEERIIVAMPCVSADTTREEDLHLDQEVERRLLDLLQRHGCRILSDKQRHSIQFPEGTEQQPLLPLQTPGHLLRLPDGSEIVKLLCHREGQEPRWFLHVISEIK